MAVKFLVKEKTTIEAEITEIDISLVNLLVEKLNGMSSVEFAAAKVEHPLYKVQKLIVKTKSADAVDVTLKALAEIEDEAEEFKKKFSQIVK